MISSLRNDYFQKDLNTFLNYHNNQVHCTSCRAKQHFPSVIAYNVQKGKCWFTVSISENKTYYEDSLDTSILYSGYTKRYPLRKAVKYYRKNCKPKFSSLYSGISEGQCLFL